MRPDRQKEDKCEGPNQRAKNLKYSIQYSSTVQYSRKLFTVVALGS